jgi:hypothetical protein
MEWAHLLLVTFSEALVAPSSERTERTSDQLRFPEY